MRRRTTFNLMVIAAILLSAIPLPTMAATAPTVGNPASASESQETPNGSGAPSAPVVTYAARHDVSPALSTLKSAEPAGQRHELGTLSLRESKGPLTAPITSDIDAAVQDWQGITSMPTPIKNFDGIFNTFGVAPPDTQGEIGYDPATNKKYYVQWVNLGYAVWDVTGATPSLVLGPLNGNTIWTGFGGQCETNNDGDPITLYDPLSNRWLMSQFAVNNPYYQCIAVSTSADPTGTWYRYAFEWQDGTIDLMNDYPKFGVWPDGYYMTANQFYGTSGCVGDWCGTGVAAFERDQMLVGAAARMVYFNLGGGDWGGMLPADFDGLTAPAADTPNYFAEVHATEWDPAFTQDEVAVYAFDVDWATPANSTFTQVATLPMTPFDGDMCGFSRDCITQPGTQKLDAIADRTMYRLAYRNFGGYESLVSNLTVDATGTDQAGVRWFEIRKTGGTWSLYQEGTYAPDSHNRWMGSIAQDHAGNMALGYSVSSSSVYPSVRYTGRLANDPLGTMPQAEVELIAGAAAQSGVNRWGDYSMMSVDPVDDCTFWYTQEYSSGSWDWRTRIGSFKFPGCATEPQGTLAGTVTDANGDAPIVNAQVQAVRNITQTYGTVTGNDGHYAIDLGEATYTVDFAAYGYAPASVSGASIVSATTTTVNISLTAVTSHLVEGVVTDAETGWPLYAHIIVHGDPFSPPAPNNEVWTDPVTGYYSVTLAGNVTYTLEANAWVEGYLTKNESLGVVTGATVKNIAVSADAASCNAPGYHQDYVYFQDFEASNGGFVISGTITSWAWGTPTSGPNGARSGAKAWATNLTGDYGNGENGYITSPNIDLSGHAGTVPVLEWWQWLRTEVNYDYASIEVSKDGGSNWALAYGEVSGDINSTGWTRQQVALDDTYNVSNFRVRFHFRSDSSGIYPGWYIDDLGIGMVTYSAPVPVLSEGFESTTFPPTGWASYNIDGGGTEWGRTTSYHHAGVATAYHTYSSAATQDGWLVTPVITVSADTTLSFWEMASFAADYDKHSLWVCTSGCTAPPTNFTQVVEFGTATSSWVQKTQSLSPYAGQTVYLGFRYEGNNADGWYIDDVAISGPIPPIPSIECLPHAGGLVVGNVYDANTVAPLLGATVSNDSGRSDIAQATVDLAVDEGFYTLFSPAGSHAFTATQVGGYVPESSNVTVVQSSTIASDFYLTAGLLTAAPTGAGATLTSGSSTVVPVTLTNTGVAAANFELVEVNAPYVPPTFGPFAGHGRHLGPKNLGLPSLAGVAYYLNPPTGVPELAAGDVIISWTTSLPGSWGIGFNTLVNDLWVGNPQATGGDNRDHRFTRSGVSTGEAIDLATLGSGFTADMAYNPLTNKLWLVNVTTDSCIYELDPVTRMPTGNQLCPAFGTSERGLAYDPTTNTFYAGSWNDSVINHFDANGVLLDSANVSLAIAGLAYNPGTGHLFVTINASSGFDVYVLDARNGYANLGGFNVAGLGSNEQAGLEMSCDGHLWAVNQTTDRVLEIDSGETGVCDWMGIPWLSEAPITGTIPSGNNQPVDLTFDATGLQPGTYQAQVRVVNDTPYGVGTVPVTLTVNAPAAWGTITGTVSGLGYCDASPAPLNNAMVFIESGTGYTATTTTNANGQYTWSLDVANSPITVTASNEAGYEAQTVTDVLITASLTTTVDFDLRPYLPCASFAPNALSSTQTAGAQMTETLTITNVGAAPLTWDFLELAPVVMPTEAAQAGTFSNRIQVYRPVAAHTPIVPLVEVIQDGGFEATNSSTFANPYWSQSSSTFGVVLCDTTCGGPAAHAGTYFVWFGGNSTGDVGYIQQTVILTPGVSSLSFYLLMGGNSVAGNFMKASIDGTPVFTVTTADQGNYGTWTLVSVNVSAFATGGAHVLRFDSTTTASGNFFVDDVALDVTPSGPTCQPNSLPWVSTSPSSGTTGADSSSDVGIVFDSTGLANGVYTGTLCLNTNDTVKPQTLLPVTLTVAALPAQLTVNVVGNGTLGQNPLPPYGVGDVVTLTATPDTGWSFAGWSGDLSGTTNPITITLSGDRVVTATFASTCVPVAGVDFTYLPTAPKVNKIVTFNGTALTGTMPITYSWNFGDGSALGSGTPITHLFPITLTTHSYTVTMTAANACGTAPVLKSLTVQPQTVFLPLMKK